MYFKNRRIFLLLIVLVCSINSAFANLMIAPTRIVFEERERAETVNLINISNKTTTYRLHWNEQRQLPDGQYQTMSADDDNSLTASSMLRFSPRQVTLAPGQRQTVRIVLRRTKDLKKFDYRSHLVFQALPSEDENVDGNSSGSKIEMKVNLGFSIPVIVRQGKFDTIVKIEKIEMIETKIEGKNIYGTEVTLSRSGVNSIYGSLKVFWKDKSMGDYKQVAILNNVAIYPEHRVRTIPISFDSLTAKYGMIKVVYEGSEDLKNKVMESFERAIIASEYKPYQP